mmetsp:Transcript_20014/g.49801  ORF Transcript_20014/g.49801 Transcript_20014/m.49801 type:complete len:745 (+) Transcript_20014:272-2506(+)|eukprot:CAMPEP_0116103574 /NCGR_PEP_ID=MMETSP0327-20121206/13957_1 /TAXON_ID=44447 /ORGANISM="Pseudo-nitzschia delicatissima, Strain B596" /LENGTH=744 /DNA_ID=CAMNT_0003595693 /DNA_START=176 /DNA_END=2410 /DNA_ORIENTATION=+
MRKNKAKTAIQKRRARAKAKSRQKEKERENWVQDRIDWVKFSDLHDHDFDNESGTESIVNLPYGNVQSEHCDTQTSLQEDDENIDDDTVENENEQVLHDFSIICWNVLADAYCSRSSHKNLPSKFQSRVFNRIQRQHHVRQTLRLFDTKLSPDLIALQEVDPPLEVAKCMRSLGYGVVETGGSSDGRVDRVDSCGLYFREENWECLNHEIIRLDDLAILRSSSTKSSGEGRINDGSLNNPKSTENRRSKRSKKESGSTNRNSLKGFERSFVRKNVTLVARIEHKPSGRKLVIVVSHLFWNPAYDYVKLCQAHYVAIRVKAFCKRHNDIPIVWCGDFNSQPQGYVHQYLTRGVVNAKAAAPWHALSHEQNSKQNSDDEIHVSGTIHDEITDQFDRLHLTKQKMLNEAKGNDTQAGASLKPKVKYLLDYTLNRFCRWLRILGLDAALETEQEEKERTRDGNITIFKRCKDEGRSLVTTASKLLHRKDCPPGTYLLDTKSLLNLESAIVHLLLSHGVKLEPSRILTRCVVCNGSIEPVHDEGRRKDIFKTYQAPDEVEAEVLDVYQCNHCLQGYWWCEKPTSSASRVKCQAARLLELCIRGGVPIEGDMGMFQHIDVEKIMTSRDEHIIDKSLEDQLDVVRWLQVENLENPLSKMASAYALKQTLNESLPFTNVTFDFVGSLDYILYQTHTMEVIDLLYVPKTFNELNDLEIANGHLLPSYDWPSDHLAIGCRISFKGSASHHCEEE